MATGKTITQRIALEGGEAIKATLAAIGKAGKQAFDEIEKASAQANIGSRISASLTGLKTQMLAIGKAAGNVGTRFSALGDSADNFGRRALRLSGVAAGVVAALAHLVISSGEASDKLRETAEQLGFTSQELSNLQFAFRLSGVGEEQFAKGITKMLGAMRQAKEQTEATQKKTRDLSDSFGQGKTSLEDYANGLLKIRKDAPENVFTKLGVSITGADGKLRGSRETLLALADAFKDLPTGADKSSLALEIFSTRNVKFLSALNAGRVGILAFEREARRVAPALTDAQLAIQDGMGDAFDTLKAAAFSAKQSLTVLFAPTFQKIFEALTEKIVASRGALQEWAKTIVASVTPVVNDLIALLEGRDQDVTKGSFLLEARDAAVAFGVGVKTAVNDVVIPTFNGLLTAFKGLLTVLEIVAKAINGLFGTEWNASTIAVIVVLGKITGSFRVLKDGLLLAASAARLFWTALGGPVTIIVGIIAAIVLFVATNEKARAAVVAAWEAITTSIAKVGEFFTGIFDAIGTKATAIWEAIKAGVVGLATAISDTLSGALNAVTSTFQSWYQTVAGFISSLIDKAKSLAQAIASAVSSGPDLNIGDGTGQRFAGGGHVRGAGGPRSDSIRAWLSNGEFVINAAAVKKYGARLFHALNGMRVPAPSFNLGGMVDAFAAPLVPRTRFATGGMVTAGASASGGRPFTLNIGDQAFSGLTAEDKTVENLRRFAMNRAVRSAGRKPVWFGG